MRADLHIHTYYSDGKLSPEKAVSLAKNNGVELMSVTDHDTVMATEEAQSYSAANGIKFVRGIEVSAYFGDVKVHTLGYNMNLNDADFKAFLKDLYEGSLRRAEDIIFKLNRAGVALTMEEAIAERYSDDTPLHVMHIAGAAAKKGYGNGNRFNVFRKYMTFGKPAYSNICRPTPEQTAEVITAAGGFCSVAHPCRINLGEADKTALIKRMKDCGLAGIEAYYSAHTTDETEYYKELAKELGILVTGGSDTHFAEGGRRIGTPYFEPCGELLQRLGID